MNSEHINVKWIEQNYGEIKYNDDTQKYELDIFGDVLQKNRKVEFVRTLKTYNDVRQIMEIENENVVDTFIRDNHIYFNLQMDDGTLHETKVASYKKIIPARRNFEELVKTNGHKLLSKYITAKSNVLIDFCCGHPAHFVDADNYAHGHNKCRYCTHERILPENDVATLRTDLMDYFVNKEEAVGLGLQSNKRVLCECPICKTRKAYNVSVLTTKGFHCDKCRDGISYPEKFMCNLLDALSIPYEREKIFDWCKYVIDGKEYYGRYDFVLPEYKIILEMDGSFHYTDTIWNDLKLAQKKDICKDRAAMEHGYVVYRIDCNYKINDDRFLYTKESIVKSLSSIFDLSGVDWEMINIKSQQSKLIEVCNLWNDGHSVTEILDQEDISRTTALDYLHKGTKYGLCKYDKSEGHRRKRA